MLFLSICFSYDGVRLYHQLTLALLKFLALPASQPYAIDTFNLFVRDFEGKLDKLRLVEIGVLVAQGLDSTFSPPPPSSLGCGRG